MSLHISADIKRPWAFVFTALIFLTFSCFSSALDDVPSTDTLERVRSAVWIESRGYGELPDESRWSVMREDFALDAWVADRARKSGFRLDDTAQNSISNARTFLERALLNVRLQACSNPSTDTIKQLADRHEWHRETPEKFEVWYIFVDAPESADEEQIEISEQRAQAIRARLTSDNFEDMARLWSDVPSAMQGGRLGAISLENRGPTFSSHVRQTTPGTISKPLRTMSGWNIIYVRNHMPSQKPIFSPEQLLSMSRQILADEELRRLMQSPAEFQTKWNELALDLNDTIQEEVTWHANYLLARQYLSHLADLETVSRHDLEVLFREKGHQFRTPIRRRAREILVTSADWSLDDTKEAWLIRRDVRNRAREIHEKVLSGMDFTEAARQFSAAPNASQGGDMGWLEPPTSFIVDTTLSGMQPGDISGVMFVKTGCWFARLEEIQPPRPKTFEEAQSDLERLYKSLLFRRITERFRGEWRTDHASKKQNR